ncbi:hypothetical protein F1542_08180 [Komagataeibacter sp. FXV3]|nr:hypothetical protein [Komagataeibacter sp. FXV3]
MKLFSKSFEKCRLFEKKAAPENFYIYLSISYFKIIVHVYVIDRRQDTDQGEKTDAATCHCHYRDRWHHCPAFHGPA